MNTPFGIKHFTDKRYTRWTVEIHEGPRARPYYILAVDNHRLWNDTPIRNWDGTILYDFPERIPAYAKRLTEQAFAWLDDWKAGKVT